MSDDFRARWMDGDDLKRLSSPEQYLMGIVTVSEALLKEDVKKTLMVQLTYPELSLIPFALLVTSRLFPELRGLAGRLSEKLNELANAQEFLRGNTEGSE